MSGSDDAVLPHLLLVDDSALVTGALRVLFEETGHRVSTAARIEEAVALARADHVDVMILDLTLPDGSGLEVLTRLATLSASPGATIAVTGHDDPALRARCLEHGCRDMLVKPVPTRILLQAVQAALVDPRTDAPPRGGAPTC